MSGIFRQKALERLKSPEELDRMLVVVNRKAWLALSVLAAACLAAVVWSIVGRIPVTVNGFGVLINPGNVRSIQSPAAGQVVELLIRVGQNVSQGQVIARVNQPELRTQLEQQKTKRLELEAFHQVAQSLDDERVKLETSTFEEQQKFMRDEIAKTSTLAEELRKNNEVFATQQKSTLARTRQLASTLRDSLQTRLATAKRLKSEGLSSGEFVLNAESSFMDSESRLAQLDTDLQRLELRELESQQAYLQQKNRVADLELQLLQLQIKQQNLRQEVVSNQRNRQAQREEVDDEIERLELALAERSQISANATGRILEISVAEGQVLSSGQPIGKMEVDDPQAELKSLAYFAVKDGKLIKPGDQVRVTPATVQRERFGSIIGRVTEVSSFPITQQGAVHEVGSEEIARALMQAGGAIEIQADLQRDPSSFSGYKWTSQGPPLKFSAGTTTTIRVTIEERAPITYVLPILRTWVYGAKDDQTPQF